MSEDQELFQQLMGAVMQEMSLNLLGRSARGRPCDPA